MSPKVIKKLRQDVVSIYYNFIKPSGLGYNNFNVGSWADDQIARFEVGVNRQGVTVYLPQTNREQYIKFTALKPNLPENVVYHPIVKSNIKNDGLYTFKTTNSTGSPMNRRFILGASSEVGQGSAVDIGISATLSASVTVGSAPIYGFEVTAGFSTTISAGYNKQWNSSESKSESREFNIDVAPRSIMNIDLTKATADCSQLTECFTTFDYAIEMKIQPQGYKKDIFLNLTFASIDDMKLYALGYGDEADPINGWFAKRLRLLSSGSKLPVIPLPGFGQLFKNDIPTVGSKVKALTSGLKSNPIKYAYTNKFKGASTGEVKVSETDLNSKPFQYADGIGGAE